MNAAQGSGMAWLVFALMTVGAIIWLGAAKH